MFVGRLEVGKENADGVGGNGDEDVPDAVQVRRIVRRPGLAEHSIENPADDGRCPAQAAPNAQSFHSLYSASAGNVVSRLVQ